MPVVYLKSTTGSDANDGSTWALAKATLAAALTAAGAGGTVYVSDNHAETQASAMTLTSPGTAAAPVMVLCVDDSAEPPTATATTATVTTTAASSMTINGVACYYGIAFSCGTSGTRVISVSTTTGSLNWFQDCQIQFGVGVGSASRMSLGATTNSLVVLRNTPLTFRNAGNTVDPRGSFYWLNTPNAVAGTAPTTLFLALTDNGNIEINGVDLSVLASGKNLVNVSSAGRMRYRFQNCKLGPSVAITTGAITGQDGIEVDLINCDSADTNYRYLKHRYQGDITQETTIVRTGGASDGTTPISRKMVSSANSKFYSPLESAPSVVWNEIVGSPVTIAVEVITDGVTLTDGEAWLEVEYLGTSGFPLSSLANDAKANILATAANQTLSAETWMTTGLASPVKQRLSVTVTPQEKGPIKATVKLAKPSTTLYYCPKVLVA